MSVNTSLSPASRSVITSLPVILENNGTAALMEKQSDPVHLYTRKFIFL